MRATKDFSKGGMDAVLSQIATYELGVPSANGPKNDPIKTGTSLKNGNTTTIGTNVS
jgi:hypothetical protein